MIITSSISRVNFSHTIEHQFGNYWIVPASSKSKVDFLLERVYPDLRDDLSRMNNFAMSHKRIPKCDVLISYNDIDIQIRIFHDHIETLRKVTGRFLKDFNDFLIKPHKHTLEVGYVRISESKNDNVLDTGKKALDKKDYLKKTIKERKSELVFFIIVSFLAISSLAITITSFYIGNKSSLLYELSSKATAPFLASSILTLTNLFIYYWKLKSQTLIIWGTKTNDF